MLQKYSRRMRKPSGRTSGTTPGRVDWNRCAVRCVSFILAFGSVVVGGGMTLTYQPASSAASPSRPPLYTEFVGPQADARVDLRCGRTEGPKVGTAHHQTNGLVEK